MCGRRSFLFFVVIRRVLSAAIRIAVCPVAFARVIAVEVHSRGGGLESGRVVPGNDFNPQGESISLMKNLERPGNDRSSSRVTPR